MSYTATEAHNRATEMTKLAIQSGAIKLNGAGMNDVASTHNAKADAKYLSTVISELTAFVLQVK